MTRNDWAYWRWFTMPDSDDGARLLRRMSDGTTNLWDEGGWVDVPGAGLDHAINTGDLGVLEISAKDAELITEDPGTQR